MDRVRQAMRSGEWLTRERIRMVAVAVLIASAAGFLYLVVTATGGVDLQGRPIGTDFSNVYAAGTYVLEGNFQAPFDSVQQFAREQLDLRRGDTILRLALSAVLSLRRRRFGVDALWPCAVRLAGGHARPLSAGDPRHPSSFPESWCRP